MLARQHFLREFATEEPCISVQSPGRTLSSFHIVNFDHNIVTVDRLNLKSEYGEHPLNLTVVR